jgi:NAD(P)-dependent dehydrogenase (short-subunit alcohol dehydrogenase family)
MSAIFSLSGKIALITGGSSGIGKAIAYQMGLQGAKVIITSNHKEELEKTYNELIEKGVVTHYIYSDLSSFSVTKTLIESAMSFYEKIDIVAHSAGVAAHEGPISSFTDEQWELTMNVNLKSAVWLTNLLIPQMEKRQEGSIIFVSSIAGLRGNKKLGLYSLSKAGLAQLARNLAVEWGSMNIRINAISPGVIQTKFSESMMENKDYMHKRLGLTPLRRVGTPDEVAGVAVMLASKAGGFITGQNIIVDGGTTISDGN